jgi:hypothetical protein
MVVTPCYVRVFLLSPTDLGSEMYDENSAVRVIAKS